MSRYDSVRKVERNRDAKRYRLLHPELSYAEIGEVFDVCASRAYRIVNGNQKRKAKGA